jgi:hypothetical protein
MPTKAADGRSREAERYRRAATDALKLLDWCIWYFRYENHGEIATRLEQNRAYIRERLTGEPEEALSAIRRPRRLADVPVVKPLRKMLQSLGLKPQRKRSSRASR